MFPARFDYRRATTVEEALSYLADDERDATVVAGGQGLIPEMKAREVDPDLIVDVGDLESLRSIDVERPAGDESGDGRGTASDGGSGAVNVGALATHAELASSSALEDAVPVIADAAAQVADVQIRNRGTIGGNLAEAAPGADLPPAALAADARIRARGPAGSRSIPAAEFFVGPAETALADDELLTAIELPAAPGFGAYAKKTHPATGYAMVGVAAQVTVGDGAVTDARLAAAGATERPERLGAVEGGIEGVAVDDAEGIAAAATRATDDLAEVPAYGDARASGEFRRRLVPAYVERAVGRALEAAVSGTDTRTHVGGDGGENR